MKLPKLGLPGFNPKQSLLGLASVMLILLSSMVEGAKSEEQTREIVRDELSKLKEGGKE